MFNDGDSSSFYWQERFKIAQLASLTDLDARVHASLDNMTATPAGEPPSGAKYVLFEQEAQVDDTAIEMRGTPEPHVPPKSKEFLLDEDEDSVPPVYRDEEGVRTLNP